MTRKAERAILPAFLIGALFLTASGGGRRAPGPGAANKDMAETIRFKKLITGNFELNAEINSGGPGEVARIFFSADDDLSHLAFLDLFRYSFRIGRMLGDTTTVWKTHGGITGPPWKIKVLKKGNFFRFWVNQATGWIRGPLGEWERRYDPWKAYVGLEASPGVEIKSFTVTTLPWLSQLTEPVIPRGPAGSFYEEQAIPGAILEYQDAYYLYFMAGMKGNEEGSSRRSVGVAVSSDLSTWEVQPQPVIRYNDFPYDNLYVNGAVVTPEDKIAVMFSAQVFPEWKGFMLATADTPLGPFVADPHNPVYKHFSHAHEFDLVRVDASDYRYLFFYAGFTPQPPSGPAGDRGYLLTSNDLINWTPHPKNPVFSPETQNNWDAVHIRPRSLNRIGDTWYLWYEGCNQWTPPTAPTHNGWWDTVGLARSRDLLDWEYYPRNPALPGLGVGPDQFDNKWVGWPRMFIKDNTGYVFYTGGSPDNEGGVQVGYRTIAIDALTNWETEGGETIDMLVTKVEASSPPLPEQCELHQNYPNPFNAQTSIDYALPRDGAVRIIVHDIIGQKVRTLLDEIQTAGRHRLVWDGNDDRGLKMPTGIYFYRMEAFGFAQVRRMVLLK